MTLLRSSILVLFVGALAWVACGGGGSGTSSSDPVALCNQGCSKLVSLCDADAGATTMASAQAFCQSTACSSTAVTHPGSCPNESAIIAAVQTCLTKTTCADLTACEATIPDCAGGGSGGSSGTGTGGSSGTGTGGATGTGTGGATGTGTGGASGATGTCAGLLACCNAANATYKSSCMQGYTAVMGSGDAACAQVLASIKSTVCP